MWQALINQAPGIAGVVIIVVLFLRYGVKPMLDYLSVRDTQWLAFFQEQREQNSSALGRMSTEIQNHNTAIQELIKVMQSHDAYIKGAVENMMDARSKRNKSKQ